jgi:hypothetical protein
MPRNLVSIFGNDSQIWKKNSRKIAAKSENSRKIAAK